MRAGGAIPISDDTPENPGRKGKTRMTDTPTKDAPDAATATAAREDQAIITASRGFGGILEELGGSVAFTTYQSGRLFFVGATPGKGLHISERRFPRPMGLAVSDDGRQLYLASQFQLFRFDNFLPPGQTADGGEDAVFVPRVAWYTGDLDAHDVGIGADGTPVFVNTSFGCLAAVSNGYSFRTVWKPPFLSQIVREDRCHLNGLAMEAGKPRYVSAVSRSDVVDGWRDRRQNGGIVMDVTTDSVVCQGLSMPHSPRLKDGQLWVLNSGQGTLGRIDPDSQTYTPVAFCPGYARGLALVGKYAMVGLSRPRENRTFKGLQLDAELAKRDVEARCGILIIDTETGGVAAWLRIEGAVTELYDVQFVPGCRKPASIGFGNDEIMRLISIDDRA